MRPRNALSASGASSACHFSLDREPWEGEYGFKSAAEVAATDVETLTEIDGIDPERAESILQAAAEAVAADSPKKRSFELR